MVYDLHAQKLAVKTIGTVESNLKYDSINYNDPITVGVMQWYGTRAAGLLTRIRDTNPSTWVGVAATLVTDLAAQPSNDGPFWTTRYLTRTEGESLASVLLTNQGLQNDQAFDDLIPYKAAAERAGIDPDTNTQTLLFFFTMYHQSPRRALEVIAAAGPGADLERVHAVSLNNSVLKNYRTRYNQAKALIIANDITGIDDPGSPSPPPETGGDFDGGDSRVYGDIKYLEITGDTIFVHTKTGILQALPNGSGRYVLSLDKNTGAPVPPPPDNPDPTVPPSADTQAKRLALVEFLTTKLDRYAYSQGPRRLNPESGMYTDCSGLVYYAYQQVLGKVIGTYTGSQYTQGRLIQKGSGSHNLALLEPGDLIFYNWSGGRPTVDHVEMYVGNGKIVGHGGPDDGPDISDAQAMATRAVNWYIRRHVE